jgi:S1 RNA binding domain protein
MALQVGDIVEGVVTAVTNFGAFVKLPDGQTGLVHISEVADTFVKNITDFINVNDTVKVKVLQINEKGRMDLSVKKAQPARVAAPAYSPAPQSFEDQLAKFLKDSEERILDLRRSQENKRREGRRN